MNKKRGNTFRIVVERVDESQNHRSDTNVLSFEVSNHDDILSIMNRVRAGTAFSTNDASALALGVKLLSGVMLNLREDPLFAEFQPAMRAFIGNLKSRVASSRSEMTAS